ncbi:MAG: hypothetical protein QM687_12785 [Ferruginibacter sp.]
MKLIRLILLFICGSHMAAAQLVLTADGPGNTYERINAALAPGYTVVETPDCVHTGFGRHIAEVFDADINQYVFEFYAHVNEDNDRCVAFDRQRTEIKTYDQSPDSLIGTPGEFFTYKWRFKVPVGFQPSSSFTHIHQVKPVGGDDDQPLFTLTARKGSPNKLELIYVATGTSGSSKVAIVNLSGFEGVWVEATEQLLVGANGSYSIDIRRVSDNVSLLSYSNNSISTIRPDNDFIRPKWGIYRSLNNPGDLRDESLRFAMFSIKQGLSALPVQLNSFHATAAGKTVRLQWETALETDLQELVVERSANGIVFNAIGRLQPRQLPSVYSFIDDQPLQGYNYYRIRLKENDGAEKFSSTERVIMNTAQENALQVFPNPVSNSIRFQGTPAIPADATIQIALRGGDGKIHHAQKGSVQAMTASLNRLLPLLKPGTYSLTIIHDNRSFSAPFVKL